MKTDGATVQFVDGTGLHDVGIVLVPPQAHNSDDDLAPLCTWQTEAWNTFSRFDTIPGCDRQTHRHADTHTHTTADVVLQSWLQQWVMSIDCMSEHDGLCNFSFICGRVEDVIMEWPVMILSSNAMRLSGRWKGYCKDGILGLGLGLG